LLWTTPAGATNVKVYRTTTPGNYGATSLAFNAAGVTGSWEDPGAPCANGSPPTANTTGGGAPEYGGTVPTEGYGPVPIGDLAIGQQWFYRVNRVVPPGTGEAGNPRIFSVRFTES
jgi:hypothetical protein